MTKDRACAIRARAYRERVARSPCTDESVLALFHPFLALWHVPSSALGTALPVDDGGEDRDVSRLARGWLNPSERIPEPMRAHARATTPEAVRRLVVCSNRLTLMAVGFSPRDASLSCFPWDPQGGWLSPSRERVCPCALMPMTLRPHGCRLQGQGGPPYACLDGSMSPDGRRKTRHGWFLHAHCLKPSCHLTVRLARRDVRFS